MSLRSRPHHWAASNFNCQLRISWRYIYWAPLFRERAGSSVQMTWRLPASWIGQYAACTVDAVQRPEFWFCLATELVRLGVACFSSNRKCVIRTKYKPTPNSMSVHFVSCLLLLNMHYCGFNDRLG
jgi:hypothetical protein